MSKVQTLRFHVMVAVPEQLGLKLESKTGPMEMLIVDSGEKAPTEN